jgi:hypothetical protein
MGRYDVIERADNFIVRRFMLERNHDHVYDYVIAKWKDQGLI